MTQTRTCPSCGHGAMKSFYKQDSVPTNSCILLSSAEEAKSYPRGSIDMRFCAHCGFISNMDFNERLTEYSGRYEETQGFSETFNKFHHQLAVKMIDKYGLHNKDVLEIGCGKGEFITLLSELGANRGVGFDPGYREDRNNSVSAKENVRFVTDFYSEKYSDYQADFVCCKMTLEHIHPVNGFIGTVRNSIGNRRDTIVFFQIPEATRILKDCAFEDIYYEHCSYFTPGSLARLFQRNGFDILNIETEYGNQYLTIEAQVGNGEAAASIDKYDDLEYVSQLVEDFPEKFSKKKTFWEEKLRQFSADGKKTVLWGSGSKGVSFLSTLDNGNCIEYVVDINPYRQGYYMAGSGQEIVSPEFLQNYRPDTVIVMNEIYCQEISEKLHALGITPEIIAV